jgi:hypothetical protein
MWGRRKQVLGPLAACSPVFLARLNGRQRESRLQILLAQWPRTKPCRRHASRHPGTVAILQRASGCTARSVCGETAAICWAGGILHHCPSSQFSTVPESPSRLRSMLLHSRPGPLHLVLTSASFTCCAYQRPPHIAEIDRLTD